MYTTKKKLFLAGYLIFVLSAVVLLLFVFESAAKNETDVRTLLEQMEGNDGYDPATAISIFLDDFNQETVTSDSNEAGEPGISGDPANGNGWVISDDGKMLTICKDGVYLLQGTYQGSVVVDAGKKDHVQLVLDGASIQNDQGSAIYIKQAGQTTVTLADGSENTLANNGTFLPDGDTNVDGVIFAKDDLQINGTGTLIITSQEGCGIVGKDNLVITGGTIQINSEKAALEANDNIALANASIIAATQAKGMQADGAILIESGTYDLTCGDDGLHAEKDVIIDGGEITIISADDAIHGAELVQINGGNFHITAAEGMEGTYVVINDGTIQMDVSGDGINAANKSNAYETTAEINGGTLAIHLTEGDNDGIDSNGNLKITGGTISIDGAQNAFDYLGNLEWSGGTVIIDGEVVDQIVNQSY